ncbi:MAG: flagellar basal-body rod protein FlgG [Limisphaerales bacterium]
MLRALYSAATGMEAQQLNLDVISNNLANVNTTGYKKSKIEFQDLLYENIRMPGAEQGNGLQLPTGVNIGHGTRVVATNQVFTEGELTQTGERLDVAIQGDGFFQVTMPDGTLAYTRDGSFKVNAQGDVTTSDGLTVQNGFQPIPAGTTAVNISANGQVTTTTSTGSQNFQVTLVRFANPAGLQNIGHNLYLETTASGTPETGNPDENGYGSLQQGYLEMSNVSVVEEMVNMIVAQRAYEVNSKAVQASDEMMQQSNNLKR